MADYVETPKIEVEGAEIEDELYDHLIAVRVEQSVNVPDMVTMRFADPGFEHFDADAFKIGNEIRISFALGDEEQLISTAEVTAMSIEPPDANRIDTPAGGLPELVVMALGNAHKLARGLKVKTYQDVTDGDIVSAIAQPYGLTVESDATSTTYPYLLQHDTDYAFLTKRANAIGFRWWVSGSKLYFKESVKSTSPGPTLEWPEDVLGFKVRFSAAETVSKVEVQGWDPATQTSFTGTAELTAGAAELGTDASAATAANTEMQKMKVNRFSGLSPVADQAEAEAIATSVAKRELAEEVVAAGRIYGNPEIGAGTEITINGLGEKLSGKYVLTSAEHVFQQGERYVIRIRAGGLEPGALVDLLGGRHGGRDPILQDRIVVGVVTNIDDPDEQGRVKVKFPTLSDDEESFWARVVSPGAGKNYGIELIPEVNDEVIVGFEGGDLRRPLVLGGVWSAKNTMPAPASTAIEDNSVVTRAWHSRVGHKLEFADGTDDASKSFTVELSDGQTRLYLGQDEVTLDAPKPITVTGKDNIDVKASGKDVTIDAGNITLQASQKLVLQAPQIEIKGATSVLVDGGKTDVKASGMLNVQAGGITAVKGSLVKLN